MMKIDKEKLLKEIEERLGLQEHPGLEQLVEEFLNAVMESERKQYLDNNPDNSGNGSYPRELSSGLGKLNLKIPRVRYGNSFRPTILPKRWSRFDKSYEELIITLLSNGYNKSEIETTLKSHNLVYSEGGLQIAVNLIKEQLDFYKTQPIKEDYFAVFIDAYHTRLKVDNITKDICIFVAIGIDTDGYKHILGFWVCMGNENKGLWQEVLGDLINRGLRKVCIFVTDNFNGLSDIIRKLFVCSDHQFCMVHFVRNLKRHITKEEDKKEVVSLWKKIINSDNLAEGEYYYDKICEIAKKYKEEFYKKIVNDKNNHLVFLKYPKELRRFIYTTNIVESVNSGLERMRVDLGGYFKSIDSLNVNVFIQFANLQDKWWTKPHPQLKRNSNLIMGMFNLKFMDNNENVL